MKKGGKDRKEGEGQGIYIFLVGHSHCGHQLPAPSSSGYLHWLHKDGAVQLHTDTELSHLHLSLLNCSLLIDLKTGRSLSSVEFALLTTHGSKV